VNLLLAAMLEEGHQVPPSIFTGLWNKVKDQDWAKAMGFNDPKLGQFWFDAIGFSAIGAIVLIVAAFAATGRYQRVPRGLQNIMEAFVSFIRGIARGFAGEQGDKYVPYLGTVFIFIFTMNLLGILPGFRSPTMTLSTTAALGITTFIMVQSYAIRDAGIVSYVKHFMGDVLWLAPLMIVVEIIGELAKPMSLSLRLFGNIFGEDNVIEQLMGLGITYCIPVQMPMYAFAIFTSFLQAFIFTTLSTIYIASKVVHEGGHGGEHGHGEEHGKAPHDEKAHGHH
jgi:F-type H+-transporting ATPase subunit a